MENIEREENVNCRKLLTTELHHYVCLFVVVLIVLFALYRAGPLSALYLLSIHDKLFLYFLRSVEKEYRIHSAGMRRCHNFFLYLLPFFALAVVQTGRPSTPLFVKSFVTMLETVRSGGKSKVLCLTLH